MSLGPDDKFLGEKVDNYCSSSEDEADIDNDGAQHASDDLKSSIRGPHGSPERDVKKGSCNTGPKGVLQDWREFKRLEAEKREGQEKEKQQLLKKIQMTCRSHLDDEKDKAKEDEYLIELGDLEDEFMEEYRRRRMQEMRSALQSQPKFGRVISLDADSYVDSIDKEKPQVTVIVHIYIDALSSCKVMNECLICLAEEYQSIKFCKINASDVNMSSKFRKNGVPALLVYKSGELLGNFIQLGEDFGDSFYASDVELFLQEHGFLPEKHIMNSVIRDKTTNEIRGRLPQEEDTGSDFELD